MASRTVCKCSSNGALCLLTTPSPARDWSATYTALVDAWLASLLADAVGAEGALDVVGMSLVAVGGYGRSELCPHSDLDVMLLRSPRRDVKAVSERVWYPIWDTGMKLGHSVCTQREALEIAESDLDTATALLARDTSRATRRSPWISRRPRSHNGNTARSGGSKNLPRT